MDIPAHIPSLHEVVANGVRELDQLCEQSHAALHEVVANGVRELDQLCEQSHAHETRILAYLANRRSRHSANEMAALLAWFSEFMSVGQCEEAFGAVLSGRSMLRRLALASGGDPAYLTFCQIAERLLAKASPSDDTRIRSLVRLWLALLPEGREAFERPTNAPGPDQLAKREPNHAHAPPATPSRTVRIEALAA
jgi:hypothetical protein